MSLSSYFILFYFIYQQDQRLREAVMKYFPVPRDKIELLNKDNSSSESSFSTSISSLGQSAFLAEVVREKFHLFEIFCNCILSFYLYFCTVP
jgi:hypothetical protein